MAQGNDEIRTAFERNTKAMSLRPSIGHGTATTRITWRDDLTCDVVDGAWKLTVGMSQKSGGTGTAPDPGVFGRTALGSCLMIGYVMWGARYGVEFSRLEVEVQADYDSTASHGVSDAPPGYRQVRYIVTIESDAPESEILRVLDAADAHSPFYDVFTRAIDVRREVRVSARSQV
jgi:uncharacterized OsmC-like protein